MSINFKLLDEEGLLTGCSDLDAFYVGVCAPGKQIHKFERKD